MQKASAPSEEVAVWPCWPLAPEADEAKAEALFWPTAWLDDETPPLPSNLHNQVHTNPADLLLHTSSVSTTAIHAS